MNHPTGGKRLFLWRQFLPGLVVLILLMTNTATAQDPTAFLRRLDTTGDGMIDPSDLDGRMGGFLRRMAENNPRIDLSRPIPVDRLADEFRRMREERARSAPPGGTGGGPAGDRGSDRGRGGDRGDRSDRERERQAPAAVREIQPLVPGFGVDQIFTPPPGFGAEGDLFAVQITEQDRQDAARAFAYFDRNRDGVIDAAEIRRAGSRGADLLLYDRNRDGVITLDEMEYRYARRRIERQRTGSGDQDRSERDSDDQGEGGDRGRGDRGRRSRGDSDPRSRFEGRSSYRVTPVVERLPAGLPDWFVRSDADGDGQLTMAEFSSTWSEAVLADFNQFDLNGDGLITAEEVLRAKRYGAVRGSPVAAASSSPSEGPAVAAAPGPAAAASPPAAVAIAGVDARTLDYFRKLFAQYDANGDGVLTRDEWVNMSRNPEAADVDGDGRITFEEYVRWAMQR